MSAWDSRFARGADSRFQDKLGEESWKAEERPRPMWILGDAGQLGRMRDADGRFWREGRRRVEGGGRRSDGRAGRQRSWARIGKVRASWLVVGASGRSRGSGTHGRAGRAGKEAAGLDSFVPREPANCRRFPWIFARRLWPSSLLNASP